MTLPPRLPSGPPAIAPCAGAAKLSFEDSFNHQLSRARINIECAFGMLTQKFLIFGRPLPWAFFKSPTKEHEDFDKPARLLRVAMKIHNPDGGSRPSWSDEDAASAAAVPPAHVHKDKDKLRKIPEQSGGARAANGQARGGLAEAA